jgi:hypothetical protein
MKNSIIQDFCIEANRLLTSPDHFPAMRTVHESPGLDGEWLKYRLYDYACGVCQLESFMDHGIYGIFAPRHSLIELADIFVAEEAE